MAPRPNRKNVAALAQSLSEIDLSFPVSKFLPLTHPSQVAPVQAAPAAVVTSSASPSYWDWPADTEAETPKTDVLSTANIEANLIQQANNNNEAEQETVYADNTSSTDSYWAERTVPQHMQPEADYWNWSAPEPVDRKQAMLNMIMASEEARVATSIESVEKSMASRSPSSPRQVESTKSQHDSYWAWESPVIASHVVNNSEAANNYWNWSEPAKPTQEQSKIALLQAILTMEAARQALSTDRVVKQLQSANTVDEEETSDDSNDNYWQWSEQLGDSYWNWNEQPQAITTGYWDW